MTNRGPEPSCDLIRRMWTVFQRVLDEATPGLDERGLYPKAVFLLAALDRHPFPAELAAALALPPPTVSHMVRQMEALGYLEREVDSDDLRRFRLRLTRSGRAALDHGQGCVKGALQRHLGCLSTAESHEFSRLLRVLDESPVKSTESVQ